MLLNKNNLVLSKFIALTADQRTLRCLFSNSKLLAKYRVKMLIIRSLQDRYSINSSVLRFGVDVIFERVESLIKSKYNGKLKTLYNFTIKCRSKDEDNKLSNRNCSTLKNKVCKLIGFSG